MDYQDPFNSQLPGKRPMRPERIDLSRLAAQIKRMMHGRRLVGYLRGKTRVRDAVMRLRGASAYRAEVLTDQLQARGFLRFLGNPRALHAARGRWVLEPAPVSTR